MTDADTAAAPPSPPQGSLSPFEAVNYFIDRAAQMAAIPTSTLNQIRMPTSELRVEVLLRRDDGAIETYVGYACSTTRRADRTRAGSATIPRPTSTRCERSRR